MESLMRLRGNRVLILGGAWLVLWSALAGFSHFYWPGAEAPVLSRALQAPGFDALGRNLLRLVLQGSVVSAVFGLVATVAAGFGALLLGCLAAVAPNAVRTVFLRILDALTSFPPLLFALGWAAVRGPGWGTLLFALLIGSVPSLTRLVFFRARELLQEDFILASRSLGASSAKILLGHVLPAAFSLTLVKAPNLFAHALIAEATLSFLGIGAPLGSETWGSLLLQGRDYLIEAPHITIMTGLPLALTVLALQLISERMSGLDAQVNK